MKRIIAIILATLMLTALTSCGNKGDVTVPDGMKLASGEAASYTLFIPEDWVIDMQTGATTAHVSAGDMSNVSVMVWDLEHSDDTVEKWWEVNVESLKIAFTDFAEVSSGECKLGGYDAMEYIYTAKLGGTEYKYRQIASVRGGAVYVMTYTAVPSVFDTHTEEVDSIAENFKYSR